MKIELMYHHLPIIAKLYGKELKQFNKIEIYITDAIYGKGNFKETLEWVNALNPKKTFVKILDQYSKHETIDSLCKATECIYQNPCKTSFNTTNKKMRKKALFSYLMLTLYGLFDNPKMEVLKRNIWPGKTYLLENILSKF